MNDNRSIMFFMDLNNDSLRLFDELTNYVEFVLEWCKHVFFIPWWNLLITKIICYLPDWLFVFLEQLAHSNTWIQLVKEWNSRGNTKQKATFQITVYLQSVVCLAFHDIHWLKCHIYFGIWPSEVDSDTFNIIDV